MSESLQGQSLQASLTVSDLEKSVKWYVELFGFAVQRRIEREGKVRSVAVTAGDVRILLNQDDGAKGWDRQKGQGMSFQITTAQKVDPIAQQITRGGWALEMEPKDMPWGVRAFRVRDPDGFRWTISQRSEQ